MSGLIIIGLIIFFIAKASGAKKDGKARGTARPPVRNTAGPERTAAAKAVPDTPGEGESFGPMAVSGIPEGEDDPAHSHHGSYTVPRPMRKQASVPEETGSMRVFGIPEGEDDPSHDHHGRRPPDRTVQARVGSRVATGSVPEAPAPVSAAGPLRFDAARAGEAFLMGEILSKPKALRTR